MQVQEFQVDDINSGSFSGSVRMAMTPHALVIDDEPLIRWALSRALRDRGCDVVEAGDAAAVKATITESELPFDVVLLDLKLPDSDDLGLLSYIRSLVPRARIILMTAFGSDELKLGALALGAARVLDKPFDVKTVAALAVDACDPDSP
jgi:DNA-binding NtrC family response regulator